VPEAKRRGAYDSFAWFYQRGWGDHYHEQARPVFEKHVFPRWPSNARVLDLCCGSGDLAQTLAGHGYRVTGIDGSIEMLRYARERVPEAEFFHEDARTFRFEDAFDAAASTFDSLNHILEIEELEAVFRNVYRALAAGGLFTFDMNMEECFRTLWRGTDSTVDEGSASITRGSYDPATKLGCAAVTMFRLDEGEWRRFDVSVFERCYSQAEIEDALARAGFRDIEMHEAYELGMRTDLALGRAFFFAVK
jgi:SAM-dependent methyltransferase